MHCYCALGQYANSRTQALAVIAYRLKFHALATYPGPWLAKVTDLYAAYYSVLGQTHTQIYELHRRHGILCLLSAPEGRLIISQDLLSGLDQVSSLSARLPPCMVSGSTFAERSFTKIDRRGICIEASPKVERLSCNGH